MYNGDNLGEITLIFYYLLIVLELIHIHVVPQNYSICHFHLVYKLFFFMKKFYF